MLSWFAPAIGLAQERTIALDAPPGTTLGDSIDVILTVAVAATDEAAVPEQPFAPFEILDKKLFVELSPDGKLKTFTFELQLLCFEVGVHELGPIRVRVTSAAGELIELESNTSTIEVQSLLANEPEAQLKPPTKPVVVEQDDYRLLIALGILLAIALGALLAWLFMRWWQKRDRPEPAPPPPPPPWETALTELHELERGRAEAISEGRTEQWVDAVSDSIRAYLGRRFGFHGLESTTDEIADQLRRAKSLAIEPQDALGFLGQCDLVKFAKASLADEASLTLIDEALTLVDRTRPAAVAQNGNPS
ncbi:MAG: hypothetical protein JRG93_08695 [Deltaproteobacteria bacterium]|nr:hypothetical protein [Deltaproteobacteria bacterium]